MRCAQCDAINPDDAGLCLECRQPPLLEGRYRLDDRIGRGANGTVYRATDFGTGDTLAIKELPLRDGLDPKRQQLFEREADILAQLDHPAIPRLHGRLIAGHGKARALFLLQDFVEGTSLQAEQARRRYAEPDILAILEEVVDILAYLHGLSPPVIHRDLKPSNIMRRPDGRLALIDFGAVRDALRDPGLGGSTVAGTFGFMAPEQFAGDASPATDIYGLGATAVALLSRQDPAALHDRSGTFAWEPHVRLSPGLTALLRRMLDPDPQRRLPDADALRAAIQALRAEPTVPAVEAEASSRPPAPQRTVRVRTQAPPLPSEYRAPLGLTLYKVALALVVVAMSVGGVVVMLATMLWRSSSY